MKTERVWDRSAPQFAAARLLDVIDRLVPTDSGAVFAWDGERVPA